MVCLLRSCYFYLFYSFIKIEDFRNIIDKSSDNYRSFQTIPILAQQFYNAPKLGQIKILQILSQSKYVTDMTIGNYLKNNVKDILYIYYILTILKQKSKSCYLHLNNKLLRPKRKNKRLDNCIQIEKKVLNNLCFLLNIKFSDLQLNKLKSKRYSAHFYYFSHNQLCKNLFLIKRCQDIYFFLNEKNLPSFEFEIKNIHDQCKHIADFKINDVTHEISFYNPQTLAIQNQLVLETELVQVKNYLESINKEEQIKIIKGVENERDLAIFFKKLNFILDMKKNEENIQNYQQFSEIKSVLNFINNMKQRKTNRKRIQKQTIKQKQINPKNKTDKKIEKKLRKENLEAFEESLIINKKNIFQETSHLIKEIIKDKSLKWTNVVIKQRSRNFLRTMGF